MVFLFKAQYVIKLSTANGPDGLDTETEDVSEESPMFWVGCCV